MSDLAVIEGGRSPLAIAAEQEAFTHSQIQALKKMNGWSETPDAELSVFFHQAKRTGLDPFARQIYLIGRYSRKKNRTEYTIQVGIDGLRLIADRTGRYAGSDAPIFGEDDYGLYAKVTVYKLVGNVRCPFTAIAYLREYADERSPMWKKMERGQLGKCAEAAALRKGFPADLSGLYIHEEMQQAGRPVGQPEGALAQAIDAEPIAEGRAEAYQGQQGQARDKNQLPATRKQLNYLEALVADVAEDGVAKFEEMVGKPISELTREEASEWIGRLSGRGPEPPVETPANEVEVEVEEAEVAEESEAEPRASKEQAGYLKGLMRDAGVNREKIEERHGPVEEWTAAKVSNWIETMQSRLEAKRADAKEAPGKSRGSGYAHDEQVELITRLADELYADRSESLAGSEWLMREKKIHSFHVLNFGEAKDLIDRMRSALRATRRDGVGAQAPLHERKEADT